MIPKILLILGFCMILAGCKECIEGHNERIHVPAKQTTRYTTLTGMPWYGKGVPFARVEHHPAYTYTRFVCDKYAESDI